MFNFKSTASLHDNKIVGFQVTGLKIKKVHYLTPDGITVSNKVDTTTERKLNAKVIDTILNSRTYASRLLGMGKPFVGKTMDWALKVIDSQQGEFFTGIETLASSATDTTIPITFAHTGFHQPAVSIMLESFANSGEKQTIDLDVYKYEEAIAEAVQKWGNAIYGTGAANQPLGLEAIVDDGTNNGTIGGQSRTTYTVLKATVNAFGSGILSLSNLQTLYDSIIAAGLESEEPNVHLTTKTIFSLYEQLLAPQIRADYTYGGGAVMPLRGNEIVKRGDLGAQTGFTVLAYRARPLLRDDAAPSGKWYMLNERYFGWRGRTDIPTRYADYVRKVDLGKNTSLDGTAASPDYAPPSSVGWFYQPYLMLPQQAGQIARFYAIGQVCGWQFRRQGKGTGITTV